ncbi:MAG: hypothetical protein HW375_1669 [Anaerolineales bacterium]|nr:hypothetical protein [Anaerolineales bacterium]
MNQTSPPNPPLRLDPGLFSQDHVAERGERFSQEWGGRSAAPPLLEFLPLPLRQGIHGLIPVDRRGRGLGVGEEGQPAGVHLGRWLRPHPQGGN